MTKAKNPTQRQRIDQIFEQLADIKQTLDDMGEGKKARRSPAQLEEPGTLDKPRPVLRNPVQHVRTPGGKVVQRVVRPRG